LDANFLRTDEDKPKEFAHDITSQLLPSGGRGARRDPRPWLRADCILDLVSAAEQTPALALGSKSKYDFFNSVRSDESVAHTSWSAFVAASAVRIAHVMCRQVVRCVDRRLS
jgi:hypothetical protein